MSVPFVQRYRIARYVIAQKLQKRHHYPLVLMLEPLFRCNLACPGCGKTEYPDEVLKRRLPAEDCLSASDECGAPIVSISGGEPLLHEGMPLIVAGLIKRKRFVYLCTNGLLLRPRIQDYAPSPYFTVSVHLDGNRARHDALTRPGVYDTAVDAIRLACEKGFRTTVNCTVYEGMTAEETATFFDFVMALGVEGITVSPAFRYVRARQKEAFLARDRSKRLFREIFKMGKGRRWRFNQSNLFLDFLAGNQAYQCTPWGNPTRNLFGWQKPCYLLVGEGHAPSFRALMEETDWSRYGLGRNPMCADCMLHSGFEPTAVNDTLKHPLKAFYVCLRGQRTEGPMAAESSPVDQDSSAAT